MAQNGILHWPVGLRRAMNFEIAEADGSPTDLSSYVASGFLFVVYNSAKTAVLWTGTGVFTISSNQGIVQYVPSIGDVASPLNGYVRIKNGSTLITDYIQWNVEL